MKAFRRFVLLFFLIIIGTPIALGGAALIKDATPPAYLNDFDYLNYDEKEEILGELDTMALTNVLGIKRVYIDEETVNKILYKNTEGFKNAYIEISENDVIYINYVWTEFNNNVLSIYALVKYRGVETTLTLKIGVTDTPDGIKISLNTFKIGQLPVPKALFTYLLNTLESYADLNFQEEYTYGDINIDKLYITVGESYIKEFINDSLETDLILFESIQLIDGKFIINYELNTENNPEALAIQSAIDELNNILLDEERSTQLTTDVTNTLDLSDPTQAAFNEDFIEVINTLQEKLANPDNIQFTAEDEELLTSLATNFSNISDPTIQQNVAQAIEGNIDPQVIADVNSALGSLGLEGYDSISDLLLGGTN